MSCNSCDGSGGRDGKHLIQRNVFVFTILVSLVHSKSVSLHVHQDFVCVCAPDASLITLLLSGHGC